MLSFNEKGMVFNGLQVIEDCNLTVVVTEVKNRSWKERLFTLPWRPWESTKDELVTKPNPNLYKIKTMDQQLVVVGHPAIIEQLRKEFLTGDKIIARGIL